MGVDIHAYSGLKKVDCHYNIDGEPIDKETGEYLDGVTVFYKNEDFPGRADDVEENQGYSYTVGENCFSRSYGGYNILRDQLAAVAGYDLGEYESYGMPKESYCVECWNGKHGPFSELINFSDCEGVIGCEVSKKLLIDFEMFQEDAEKTNDEYFIKFYKAMRNAFEIASNNGAVEFR